MKTSSAKSKGRRCATATKELMEKYAPDLRPGDIIITSSGETGPDLKLSPAAREIYPLAIECKNQEAFNIWKALKQAESHQREESEFPLVIFTRNRSELYCALEFDHFLKLIR